MGIRKVLAIIFFCLIGFNLSFSKNLIKPDFVKAKVIRVIDGDTIVVSIPKTEFNDRKVLKDLKFKVRLIGVDTPESKINKRAKLQAEKARKNLKEIVKLGLLAKKFTQKLLPKGKTVFLEFDVEPQDMYGRLLAYVWLKDGIMVNTALVCNGYAYILTVPPNVKYEKLFRKCFRKAFLEKKGLWGLD